MSYRAFLEEIRKNLLATGYLLSASDPFLLTEATSSVKALVRPEERDFNFQRFDLLNLNTVTFDDILDVLNTVPFFSGRKYVVIENSQKLLKKDSAKLAKYMEKASESSTLVLLYEGSVKKETKGGLSAFRHIPLDINERDIHAWLRAKAKEKGAELSDIAAEYLIGVIGPDLGLLSSEVEKCVLIGKPKIEKEDIIDIVEGKRTFNAFALVDAIRAKDARLAFKIYRVLRATEEPYGIVGALNWQFSRSLADKNSPVERKTMYDIFKALNRADLEIKSSGGPYPMEFLLLKLLRLSKVR